MEPHVVAASSRRDVIWQDPATAAGYHRSRSSIPFEQEMFDVVRRVVEAHGLQVRRLLDLGCGDGIATAAMFDRFPLEWAMAVDFSPPMLVAARERFAASGQPVRVVEGDLMDRAWLSQADVPLDLVISRFAIHHLPHERKRSLYGDILGLLRPGGMFINIEHVASPNVQYQAAFERMLVEGIHALAGDSQTIEETERAFHARQDAGTNILASVEAQCDWLRELGYVDVDCSFKVLELAVFGGRRPA